MRISRLLRPQHATHVRWLGTAAVTGGTLFIVADTIFALTHGTQSEDQHQKLLGVTSLEYARVLQPAIWLCCLVGVAGVDAVTTGRAGRLGAFGYRTALLGYALAFISWVLQVWIGDPYGDFQSLPVQGGFTLWLLSVFVQTIGMTLFGWAQIRAKALPRWSALPFCIGLLLLPTGLLRFFIFDSSDGSPAWTLFYALSGVPFALCWILLGWTVRSHDRRVT